MDAKARARAIAELVRRFRNKKRGVPSMSLNLLGSIPPSRRGVLFRFSMAPLRNHFPRFFRYCADWGWAGLMVAAVGLEEAHEYGIALALAILGAVSLCAMVYHWEGLPDSEVLTLFGRVLGYVFALCCLSISILWIIGNKGTQPWSRLSEDWSLVINSYVTHQYPKTTSPAEPPAPTPPIFALNKTPHITPSRSTGTSNSHEPAPKSVLPQQLPPEPSPVIVVKGIQLPVKIEAMKDPTLQVNIVLKGSTGITVYEYRATGPAPYYDDADLQNQEENSLWEQLVGQAKSHVPLQLPANNDTMSLPSVPRILTQDEVDTLNSKTTHLYYLYHIVDSNERTVLDFCGHLSSDLQFLYCRLHNGP